MAQFSVQRTAPSFLALTATLLTVVLVFFVIFTGTVESFYAAGEERPEGVISLVEARDAFGASGYLLGIGAVILGFWSKEDQLVATAFVAVSMVFMLDVLFGHFGIIGPF